MRKQLSVQRRLASAASVAILGISGSASGQFTNVDVFKPEDPVGGPYEWSNPLNWDSGFAPTSTTLVRVPEAGETTLVTVPGGVVVHGVDLHQDTGGTAFSLQGTDPVVLTSLDSVYDPALNLAPAINATANAVGTLSFRAPVQLGNGSIASGVAYVNSNTPGNGVQIALDKVTQAPGTSFGITFTGPGLVGARAATNGGNYLTNRWDITGKITIARNADDTNARVLVFNSIFPYGAGLPNMQIDGSLIHMHNGNVLILNSIDSAYDTAILSRSTNGTDVAIGANGQDGSFAGRISSTATSLYKIGGGVQVLSNGTSAYARTTLIEGVISVNSIADQGTNSALGNGSLVFDGGALRYTGSGHSSNRLLQIGFRGATIDASGTDALVLSGETQSTDIAHAFGDNTNEGPSQTVTNMYGINGLGALAAAGSLQITNTPVGLSNTNGAFPVSIDETTRTMVLPEGSTNNAPGNGFGQPRFLFTTSVGVDRTLSLTGTNTANNTLGGNLTDSSIGGRLGVTKSGSGKWVLDGTNTYTGPTVVNGGTLQLNVAAHTPVLAGDGTTSFADIQAGSLVFDYNDGVSVADSVLGILQTGYGQPVQFADGLIRSTTATAEIGLGWKDDSEAQQVLVRRTFYGDADLDGDVDGIDVGLWAQNFTGELGGAGDSVWTQGDWDYDGDVDGIDVGLWAQNFTGELGGAAMGSMVVHLDDLTSGAVPILQSMGITVVPEPAGIGALAAAAMGALGRRRRRA